MTTTLTNVNVVGSPDYYLELESGKSSGNVSLTRDSTTVLDIHNCRILYRFKLTSGDPTSDGINFYTMTDKDGRVIVAHIDGGILRFKLTERGKDYNVGYLDVGSLLELNHWYDFVVEGIYNYSTLQFSIRDSATGNELISPSIYAQNIYFYITGWSLDFSSSQAGVIVSKESKLTDLKSGDVVVLDLSDIIWDPTVMFGSTNAKFSAASEPVLETLSVTPATSAQTLTPPSGVDGFNQVNVSAVENVLPENIKLGASILGVNGTVVEKVGENKSDLIASTSTSLPITFTPSAGYNCMDSFTLTSIQSLESFNIRSGVTIAGVTGSVIERNAQSKTASIAAVNSLPVDFSPDPGYNCLAGLQITNIENLQASNIKEGIQIAGVTGTAAVKNGQDKHDDLLAVDSLPYTVNPGDDGLLYNCFNSFTLDSIENLEAANIKKDVQIAGVTGTYEGSGSSGVITVSAHNDKSSAVQAGQKVLVHKGVVSGVASYSIEDVTEISAPNYLKNYTFGVAVNAIPQAQGGSVVIPADMGTAVGKYVVNTNGGGHAYFNNYNVNDADFGSDYLGYATTQTDGYAQIALPNVPYTSIGSSAIRFAFKRLGTATEAKHLVAKVTNSWDTSKISVEEPEDVFRIYLTSTSSGFELEIQYKKTDGTFGTISPSGYYMTSVGSNLFVTLQLRGNQQDFLVYVDGNQIGTSSFTDLTTTENLRNYNIWNPNADGNYKCEYLLAYEDDGYDELGCACSFSNYGDSYFLGGKYYY